MSSRSSKKATGEELREKVKKSWEKEKNKNKSSKGGIGEELKEEIKKSWEEAKNKNKDSENSTTIIFDGSRDQGNTNRKCR